MQSILVMRFMLRGHRFARLVHGGSASPHPHFAPLASSFRHPFIFINATKYSTFRKKFPNIWNERCLSTASATSTASTQLFPLPDQKKQSAEITDKIDAIRSAIHVGDMEAAKNMLAEYITQKKFDQNVLFLLLALFETAPQRASVAFDKIMRLFEKESSLRFKDIVSCWLSVTAFDEKNISTLTQKLKAYACHNEEVYMSFIHNFLQQNKLLDAAQFASEMVSSGAKISSFSYSVLALIFARLGRWDVFTSVAKLINLKNSRLSTFKHLILGALILKDYPLAQRYLVSVYENQVHIPEAVETELWTRIINQMKADDQRLDSLILAWKTIHGTFAHPISDKLCQTIMSAIDSAELSDCLLMEMKRLQFRPSKDTYLIVVWLWSRVGRYDKALIRWEVMLLEGHKPTKENFEAMLEWSLNNERRYTVTFATMMQHVWVEMKKRSDLQPDQKTYHLAITACERYCMFQSAINLLKEMEQQGIEPLPETPTIKSIETKRRAMQRANRQRRKRNLKRFPETRGVNMKASHHVIIFEIVKRYLGDRSLLQPEIDVIPPWAVLLSSDFQLYRDFNPSEVAELRNLGVVDPNGQLDMERIRELRNKTPKEIVVKWPKARPYFQRLRQLSTSKAIKDDWNIPSDIRFEKVSTFPLNKDERFWKNRFYLLGECIEEGVGKTYMSAMKDLRERLLNPYGKLFELISLCVPKKDASLLQEKLKYLTFSKETI
jgi:pentatricopeptide repeat protein